MENTETIKIDNLTLDDIECLRVVKIDCFLAQAAMCDLLGLPSDAIQKDQRKKGMETYGKPLSEAGLTKRELLRHAAEELVDACEYIDQLLILLKEEGNN